MRPPLLTDEEVRTIRETRLKNFACYSAHFNIPERLVHDIFAMRYKPHALPSTSIGEFILHARSLFIRNDDPIPRVLRT